jgi:hypothetical protein
VSGLSTIEKVSVTATTSATTLDQPVVVAEMPRGETVLSLYGIVGTYLAIGTSKGLRVAVINTDGSLTMGPLVVQSSDGVNDCVADGSFLYCTVGAQGNAGDREYRAGLYRVDLGQNLNSNPLDFAHAADLVVPSGADGTATQVTTASGKLWIGLPELGVYRQADTYVSAGWLETGRIRLGTVENKGWRDLRLLTQPGITGTVTGFASTSESGSPSTWTTVITADGDRFDIAGKLTSVAPSPASNLYVALELSSNVECSCPARLIGYQVRAVPAPERTRLLQVPVLLFDYQTDRKGYRIGKPGYAWDTLSKLQDMEESTAVVQWRDYTTGEAATAYVERVTFTRLSPPTNRASGVGGVCQVLLRLV